ADAGLVEKHLADPAVFCQLGLEPLDDHVLFEAGHGVLPRQVDLGHPAHRQKLGEPVALAEHDRLGEQLGPHERSLGSGGAPAAASAARVASMARWARADATGLVASRYGDPLPSIASSTATIPVARPSRS